MIAITLRIVRAEYKSASFFVTSDSFIIALSYLPVYIQHAMIH